MFNNMWDVKEPKHYSKRVGREVPGVVAVLCVVNTGPMLIAVTTITEMVILYKYVEIIIIMYTAKHPCINDLVYCINNLVYSYISYMTIIYSVGCNHNF